MALIDRRVKRVRRGGYSLNLPPEERDLLRSLPSQLAELIREGDDPALLRLYPPAYTDDPKQEEQYRHYMREDLREHHLEALEIMEKTVDATHLDEEQMGAWLRALNELRLVLGTRLDVTEELLAVRDSDPRAPGLALYHYLGWLQEQVVRALRLT